MSIMFTFLQCIDTLRLPLWAWLHEDGLRPQDTRGGALLEGLGHQTQSYVLSALSCFNSDSFQPELGSLGVLVSSVFQNGPSLCDISCGERVNGGGHVMVM